MSDTNSLMSRGGATWIGQDSEKSFQRVLFGVEGRRLCAGPLRGRGTQNRGKVRFEVHQEWIKVVVGVVLSRLSLKSFLYCPDMSMLTLVSCFMFLVPCSLFLVSRFLLHVPCFSFLVPCF